MAITITGFEQEIFFDLKNSTGSVSGERYTGASLDGTNPHGLRFTISGGPIDIGSTTYIILINLRTQNNSQFELEDSNGNTRSWDAIQHSANNVNTWVVFESSHAGYVDSAGFDPTDVVYFNYLRTDTANSNNTFFIRPSIFSEIILTATTGDNASFESIVNGDNSPFGQIGSISQVVYPITIGDDDPTIFGETSFSGATTKLDLTDQSSDVLEQFLLSTATALVKTNISGTTTISSILLVDKGYQNNSSGTITHQNWTIINGINIIDFAGGIIDGLTSFVASEPILGGISNRSLGIVGSLSSYAFYWKDGATLANSRFESTVGSALRITESKTLTSIEFKECQTDFFVDVPSGTITITVDNNSTTDHPGGFLDSGYVAAKVSSAGATVVINAPSASFSAPNLTSAVFNRIRARLSLVPGGPVQLNDDNSVSSGGAAFLPSDVNLANNTINVSGAAGKVSAASTIRVHGSDLPAPLDQTGIYYPSGTYDGSDNISLSTTPGGTAVNLTDVGTVAATPDMFMGIWTELDNSLVTSGAYTVDLNTAATGAGISLANNDVLTLQAIHHDAPGTGGTAVISEYLEQSFQYAGATITTLETLRQATLTMQLIQELGLDGSQVTGYSFNVENPAKIQIDTNKTNISTLELLAFYYHIQSTEAGIRFARGNVVVENANRIKLLGNITFDASVPSVMSGPYMFSPNGSWQAPESATITQLVEDTRAVVITQETPINLPDEVLQAINSVVYGVGHLIANGGVLTPTQSDQLETLYNATEDGTGATVFSTASLANAPSGGGGSVTQQFIRDALTLAPTAGTPAANSIDSQLADIPTVAEFEARTLLAADYFDPAADTVARVTLVDTTTDLTNLPAIPANWLTGAGIDPTAVAAFQAGLSTLVNDTAILTAIGAIPTNPLLTTDTRLNNLDATISSRLEGTAYTAPLDATATTTAATAALTAYDPPTRAELTADIASIISQGNTAWITATGFSTFDPGATAVTITQAFPANFASLAISGTGGVTADNMRGTDNANTNFTPLDPEFQRVRNLVAAGL